MPPLPYPPVFSPKQDPAADSALLLPRGRGRGGDEKLRGESGLSEGGRNPAASCLWAGCRWKNRSGPAPPYEELACCPPAPAPPNCPLAFVRCFLPKVCLGRRVTPPHIHQPSRQAPGSASAPTQGSPAPPDGQENRHLLQDFVVLDGLLQVLQVGVDAADGAHVGLQQLNVPFLREAGHGGVGKEGVGTAATRHESRAQRRGSATAPAATVHNSRSAPNLHPPTLFWVFGVRVGEATPSHGRPRCEAAPHLPARPAGACAPPRSSPAQRFSSAAAAPQTLNA